MPFWLILFVKNPVQHSYFPRLTHLTPHAHNPLLLNVTDFGCNIPLVLHIVISLSSLSLSLLHLASHQISQNRIKWT
eukprot:m.91299 g.91299  ORF g.91299 m.91299 type:complete len:77 (+) comp8868_c0_seq4:195-425(+)